MDYVLRSPFSVSIIDISNMTCDRTQISGLAARAHNAQGRIGGCGHTSGKKRGEKTRGGHYYTCCTDTRDRRFDPVRIRIL